MREIIFLNEKTAQTKHDLKKHEAWVDDGSHWPPPKMSDATLRYIAGQTAGNMLAKSKKIRGMSGREYEGSSVAKENYSNKKSKNKRTAEKKKNLDAESLMHGAQMAKVTG
jgi:hypothetical protein